MDKPTSYAHDHIEDCCSSEYTDITLRFKNVEDLELLMIELGLLLDSVNDDGYVLVEE